jgi:hypothetical protein
MSGGRFDYTQYHINTIADSIESELERQGKEKPKDELYFDKEYLEKYPEEKYYYIHPLEVQNEMRKAIKILRQASVYAQRVDWYLSGDDGDENFLKRLKAELNAL